MERLYALCLTAGLEPNRFWNSTLAEVLCFLEYKQRTDKAEWSKWSQLMSLTYNLHRGKAKPLQASDFTPYEDELRHGEAKPMTPDLQQLYTDMGVIMQHGTK